MTPNFLDTHEMPLTLPVDPGCLHCHASNVQESLPDARNHFSGVPFQGGGISAPPATAIRRAIWPNMARGPSSIRRSSILSCATLFASSAISKERSPSSARGSVSARFAPAPTCSARPSISRTGGKRDRGAAPPASGSRCWRARAGAQAVTGSPARLVTILILRPPPKIASVFIEANASRVMRLSPSDIIPRIRTALRAICRVRRLRTSRTSR